MESFLLRGGKVWDGSGKPAFPADVLVAGNRIAEVRPQGPCSLDGTTQIDIPGHTVIPGLVDGHAHLPFLHKADIADTGDVPPEEHTLRTTQHARVVLEAGFTSCVSGGSAKPRIDGRRSAAQGRPVRGRDRCVECAVVSGRHRCASRRRRSLNPVRASWHYLRELGSPPSLVGEG